MYTISQFSPTQPIQGQLVANLNIPYKKHSAPVVKHPMLEVLKQAQYGHLLLHTPEGHRYSFGGLLSTKPKAHLDLHDWKALDALFAKGEVGFAEAYMDGLWDTDDLAALLTFGLLNADVFEAYFHGNPLYAAWSQVKAVLNANSLMGSRRNIQHHYDLGNDFYALWLDESMTYSGALFEEDSTRTLEEAQQAKYNRILDKLRASPNKKILEIGCGWGGFAEAAARRGLHITSITISDEQYEYAKQRIEDAGLQKFAKIEKIDYRQVKGQYDHIVSIGMFEHVGEEYWPVYFRTIQNLLKPNGRAMIQTITIDEQAFLNNQGKVGFIERYIFPGGVLPSKPRFLLAAEDAQLDCKDMFGFGYDYARTLKHWLTRFEAKKPAIRAMGFDEHFIRMWRFYLCASMAAFLTRRTDVVQFELVHME